MGNYLPSTPEEREAMLRRIGVSDWRALYRDVPEALIMDALKLPEGKSELETLREMTRLAEENQVYRTLFRGAGAYRHYIPAIVKQVTSKESFVTAYTPYQAEISQGVLQSIFEYQTLIARLTGLDVSNASLYDGATAVAEATAMGLTRKRHKILVAETIHPSWRKTLETYYRYTSETLVFIPSKEGVTTVEALNACLDESVATVFVPQINFYGQIEDCEALAKATHEAGAIFAMGVHPIAAALLKDAGACGADIACGEGQPMGLSVAFGGPHLGFIACREKLTRQLPGRIVGQTYDAKGRRAFVLTLQAREQHIRREKAGSNICTNQALCAFTASVWLSAMGKSGLKEAATQSYDKAHAFQEALAQLGFERIGDGPFFNEFVTTCPVDYKQLNQAFKAKNMLPGLYLDEHLKQRMMAEILPQYEGGILWCLTEMNSDEEMDEALALIREVAR